MPSVGCTPGVRPGLAGRCCLVPRTTFCANAGVPRGRPATSSWRQHLLASEELLQPLLNGRRAAAADFHECCCRLVREPGVWSLHPRARAGGTPAGLVG